MLESGTSNDMFARFLPAACSCAVIVLCTASVACCRWWLASGLPSPPGSTPSLSFTSWTCCWSSVLLLLAWSWAFVGLHGFTGCYYVMMCKNLCCSWCGVQGLWCSCVGAVLVVWVLFPLVIFIRSAACFASSSGAASSSFSFSD
jgi:hypothetical protein